MSENITVLVAGAALLLLILVLANLAEQRRQRQVNYLAIAWASFSPFLLLYSLTFVIGIRFASDPALINSILNTDPDALRVEQFHSLTIFTTSIWASGLIGLLVLFWPVRRALAYLIPIEPANPVHTLALALIPLVILNLFTLFGIGLENLNSQLQAQKTEATSTVTITALWTQQVLTALIAAVGVGWFTRRNFSETFQRLGIVKPTLGQVGLGIGLGLLFVPLGPFIAYLASLIGIVEDTAVQELTEQLLGPLFRSFFGIFTAGVAAAIGEETLLRGALQPRFGLLLTTVIFAMLHGNYGLSVSTAVVFLLGLVLGLVRIRYNTTTAMIIHAVYNAMLALIAYLGLGL